jgi:hypothetical protein
MGSSISSNFEKVNELLSSLPEYSSFTNLVEIDENILVKENYDSNLYYLIKSGSKCENFFNKFNDFKNSYNFDLETQEKLDKVKKRIYENSCDDTNTLKTLKASDQEEDGKSDDFSFWENMEDTRSTQEEPFELAMDEKIASSHTSSQQQQQQQQDEEEEEITEEGKQLVFSNNPGKVDFTKEFYLLYIFFVQENINSIEFIKKIEDILEGEKKMGNEHTLHYTKISEALKKLETVNSPSGKLKDLIKSINELSTENITSNTLTLEEQIKSLKIKAQNFFI